MADNWKFRGDQEDLHASAEKLYLQADTFNNHLQILDGIRQEYASAVVGKTGTAIQEAYEGARQKGKALEQIFRDVVDALNDSGAKFGAQDEQGASSFNQYKYDF
ncbi:WXG100 family type VII secretion target [Nocardia amamiensis]|uniref:WXG100 family type VII secretion target n=1 Tax=Nocardia amamiensis TaxID=404578 RepID=UPI000834E209|nr:hypothetical protein [Nocardia amamiensis]